MCWTDLCSSLDRPKQTVWNVDFDEVEHVQPISQPNPGVTLDGVQWLDAPFDAQNSLLSTRGCYTGITLIAMTSITRTPFRSGRRLELRAQ